MTGWCRRCSRLMTGTRLNPRCVVCGLLLTPEAQVDIDAPLSGPGPLARKQLDCTWPAGPLGPMGLSGPWPGPRSCFSHEGQQCARGDDAQSCPYAVWLELDCSSPYADCEGLPVEALPEDAGTELEGVAIMLSDAWAFVDSDESPYADWEEVRLGTADHQRAYVRWMRRAAATVLAQARITTGNCEGPGCAQ